MTNKPTRNDVELLLHRINKRRAYKQMFSELPLKQFVSLAVWPSVNKRLTNQLFVWLHTKCLLAANLEIDPSASFILNTGKLHYLNSETLAIGYLIELPKNHRIEITASYLISHRNQTVAPVITDLEEVQGLDHILSGPHLSAFVTGETSQIIAAISKELIDYLPPR